MHSRRCRLAHLSLMLWVLKLVENMTGNLLFIGTVKEQKPIYHAAALKNFTQFNTASYAYYRTYPYRPSQWFLDE